MTPSSFKIIGHYDAPSECGCSGYVYEYQLLNMLGQPLVGDGYEVKEFISQRVIWNTTGSPVKPYTSSDIFQAMRSGIAYDLVAAAHPLPTKGTGFEAIYTQRFKIRYSMGVVQLSTVMQHVIEAEDKSLVRATAIVVQP